MNKRWLSALLAALMILCLPVTALADGEEVPEPEPAQTEEAPADAPQTMALDAPEAAAGVTVSLTGAVEQVEFYHYDGPDGTHYYTHPEGTYYGYYESEYADPKKVWVDESGSLATQVTVAPGCEIVFSVAPEYELTVDGGSIEKDEFSNMLLGSSSDDFYVWRFVTVAAPESGTVTVSVVPTDDILPKVIPFTFYNFSWDVVSSGDNWGSSWEWEDTLEDGTGRRVVTTGGEFAYTVKSGYTIQVLEGGYVAEVTSPTLPDWEPGCTRYVLHVNDDAESFAIAVVKAGEPFTAPEDQPAPETEEGPAPAAEGPAADQPAPIAATGTFKDVADSAWYKDTVERAYAAGMIAGTGEDTFSPNACASRGQTVTMIWRQAGTPIAERAAAFQDLTADYYKDAVAWANAIGAVNGASDSSFEPDSAVTREQLAAMLYRMAGQPTPWSGSLLGNYSDGGDVQPYAQMAMQWALDYGIVTGYEDGTLRPGNPATRAEVCAMLLRYDELVGCYPTSMPAAGTEQQPEDTVVTYEAPASHTERNLDNPNLIKPKRDKIDDGLYDNGEDGGQWIQQWSETYWDLDRSGEDIMWCTRNLTRLYSGPGTSYEVICTLYSTYEVSRLGPDENGWTPVVYHEYETGEGFTGWDYTGYVRTDCLSKVVPSHPHVADFSSGPALEKWCNTGIPEGDLYADYGASANGTFYHEAYEPVIDGDTYTYTLRGGGHIIIHNVDPAGMISVEASGEVETHSLLLFICLENGYGIKCSEGYGGGYGLSPSGDGLSCELYWETDVSNDEDIEMTMIHGDGAPRVLQVTIKDPLGGSRAGDGTSRFIFLDESGSLASYHMAENFFNLKPGYKLKSLSPYASVGKVDNNELHFFTVKGLPTGTDEIFFEVVRG